MLTFTVGGKGRGVYSKLRLSNYIKSYITYCVANSSAEIYFFSNIEIGHSLKNPHVHTQIWSDDKEAVRAIYEKVITKFGLVASRCRLSEPQQPHDFYNYLIKDYSKDLADDEVWHIEQTKKRMRKTLGLKLRFYSKSKSKYSQKAYRYFYRAFGVLRDVADDFMDWFFSLFFKKERVFLSSISSFIRIKNKIVEECLLKNSFLVLWVEMDILFYSPSTSPPCFVFLVLVCRLMTIGLLCVVALY